MPCFSPIRGWRGPGGKVTFSPGDAVSRDMVRVPCGRCKWCRKVRALSWAVRIMCESTLHDCNSFVTLTYRDNPGGLNYEHVQLWFKRFRKRLLQKIRYFVVGEYGSKNSRAHWHAVVFGWYPEPSDCYEVKQGLYGSHLLDDTWGHGFASVGELSPASAQYVAQYALKKFTGEHSEDFYTDVETGEICKPEMAHMSRRPGIGRIWFEQNIGDVFPSDSVYFSKGVVRPPKAFFERLKVLNPDLAELVTKARREGFDESEFFRLVWHGVAEKVSDAYERTHKNRHKEL